MTEIRMGKPLPRLLITLAIAAIVLVLGHFPLPFLAELRSYMAGVTGEPARSLTWMALGVTPFVSAALLVEVMATLVPRWRWLRRSGEIGRIRLWRKTIVIGVVFAAFQAAMMVHWIWVMRTKVTPVGFPPLVPAGSELFMVAVALVAGSGSALGLAGLITRYGLGNGYSVVLTVVLLDDSGLAGYHWFISHGRAFESLGRVFVLAVVAAALVVGVMGWSSRQANPERRLPLPSSGTFPLTLSLGCMELVQSLVAMKVNWGPLPRLLASGGLASFVVMALVLVPASLLFGWAFNRPVKVESFWRAAGKASMDGSSAQKFATVRSTLLLLGLLAVQVVLASQGASFGVIVPVVVGVVIFDLVEEWRARTAGIDRLVDSLHAPYTVAPVLHALGAVGISAHAFGLRYRTLLQFLGPYVPIGIFVQAKDEDCARSLMAAFRPSPPTGQPVVVIQG